MAFIPRKILRGKHYGIYKPGVKTKAAYLKEALKIALKIKGHEPWIDFIPAKFTLQVHFWFQPEAFKDIKEIHEFIFVALKAGKDPVKELEVRKDSKAHYDLRIQKLTAPTWAGFTPFRAPWTGTAENKVLGSAKGYQSIVPEAGKLEAFLAEQADKEMAREGVAERRDKLEWMKIRDQWFPINSPGNPQKNIPAAMVAIEFYKSACIHRREIDFLDVTFFGDYLKGRYFNRLVSRVVPQKDLMKWQQEAISSGKTKQFYALDFYMWKAKTQWGDKGSPYSMMDVLQAALGKKTLERLAAPVVKGEKQPSPGAAPLASKVLH